MYDALIFDIDGTLWYACPAIAAGWNTALQEIGSECRVTTRDIERVAGKPYEECVEMLLPGLAQTNPTALALLEQQENMAVEKLGGILYPDVADGIKALADRYKIFIVSNCQRWYLDIFFQTSNLQEYLDGYDCYGLSGLRKNEMLENMKKKYRLENPVYIGDTVWDEEAAEKSGMAFMHVTYGFGTAEKPVQSFFSFVELVNFFEADNSTPL